MGTPEFALSTLEEIYNSKHKVLAVVSQPDKPCGRGMKIMPTPTKEFATKNNIEVLQPEKIKKNEEFIQRIKDLNPDIIVVVAYGKILPESILNIPKYGCMNVHASLLPKLRGAAPIQWAIISGEATTGVTTMKLDKGMDTGDTYLKEEISIEPDETYGSLYEKLKTLGAKLAVKTLDEIEAGTVTAKQQTGDFTIAPMVFKEQCRIDFNKTSRDICNLIRGVNPAPVAWTEYEEKVYKVWNAKEANQESIDLASAPGTIVKANSKEGLIIKTLDGAISITEIQAPGSKKMNTLDFLRGNAIKEGTILK